MWVSTGRRVDTEPVAADQLFVHGSLGEQVIDPLPGLRPDCIFERAESRIVNHPTVIDSNETTKEVAVIDSHDDSAVRFVLDGLTDDDSENGLGSDRALSTGAVPLRALEDLLEILMNQADDLGAAVEDGRDPLVALVVFVCDLEIRGLKIELELVISLHTHGVLLTSRLGSANRVYCGERFFFQAGSCEKYSFRVRIRHFIRLPNRN